MNSIELHRADIEISEARELDRQARSERYERVAGPTSERERFISEGVYATGAVWPHAIIWTDNVSGERRLFPCDGAREAVEAWKRGILERDEIERSEAA